MTWIKDILQRPHILLHSAAIAEIKRRQLIISPLPPLEIFIEVTAHCNLRCPICPVATGLKRQKGFMDWDLFKKIIDQVKGKVPMASLFLAGESFLHKRIFDMIKYASEKGIYTRIHTNGVLVTEDKASKILESGLDELSFSFDGPTKERYEKIRVGGDYHRVLNNIQRFLSIKKMTKAKKPYTIIQAVALPGEDMKVLEKNLANMLKKHEPDEIKVIPSHSWAGVISDYVRNVDAIEKEEMYSPCSMIWDRITVTWDGYVLGCCADLLARCIMGNVRETKILDIWNSKKYIELRQKLISRRYREIEPCRHCDVLWCGETDVGLWRKLTHSAALWVLKNWMGCRTGVCRINP